MLAVGVARVYCHDDEIGDEQRDEPDGGSLSNLFLCANRGHLENLKKAIHRLRRFHIYGENLWNLRMVFLHSACHRVFPLHPLEQIEVG